MKAAITAFILCLALSATAQIAVDSTELELRAVRIELANLKQSYRQLQAEKISAARSRDAERLRKRQDGWAWLLLGVGIATIGYIAVGGYRAIYLSSK